MRNRMKKIIMGLCLGITMLASGFMFTGCSSDITFNQDNLDSAIKNINEYVETQNNFSSEFAKNTLNSYLMNAMKESANSTSFKVTANQTIINSFGSRETNTIGEYKYITTNSTTKEMFICNDDTIYRESIKDTDGKFDMTCYSKSAENKTYTVTENVEFDVVSPLVELSGISNYTSAINFINYMLEDIGFSDFIMETKENNVINFKAMATTDNVAGYVEIEFTDTKLTKIESYSGEILDCNLICDEITFEHNLADFTFDKTGYTLVTE